MRIHSEGGRWSFRSSFWSIFLITRCLNCILVIFVFEILHTCHCILFSAGKERCGLAEVGTGLQSAPRQVGEKRLFRSVSNFALSKLLPHLGCRVGQDGIDERGNYSDRLSSRCEHTGLKRSVISLGAVGWLLPRRIGGEIAIGLADQVPDGLQRLREIQFIEGGCKLGPVYARCFRAEWSHS